MYPSVPILLVLTIPSSSFQLTAFILLKTCNPKKKPILLKLIIPNIIVLFTSLKKILNKITNNKIVDIPKSIRVRFKSAVCSLPSFRKVRISLNKFIIRVRLSYIDDYQAVFLTDMYVIEYITR